LEYVSPSAPLRTHHAVVTGTPLITAIIYISLRKYLGRIMVGALLRVAMVELRGLSRNISTYKFSSRISKFTPKSTLVYHS
jgi:hypothetical protein